MRRTILVVIAGALAVAAAVVLVNYFFFKPAALRVADLAYRSLVSHAVDSVARHGFGIGRHRGAVLERRTDLDSHRSHHNWGPSIHRDHGSHRRIMGNHRPPR